MARTGRDKSEKIATHKNVEVLINGTLTKTTARVQCQEFLDEIVPAILAYGKPDALRCVFWFDN